MASKEIIFTVENGRNRSDAALDFTGAAVGLIFVIFPPTAAGKPCDNAPGTPDQGNGTDVATKTRAKVQKPHMYKVLILNDDYTPMDFVVEILQRFFDKNYAEAVEIMFKVHRTGTGLAGIFTYEVAETKVNEVMVMATQYQHPLQTRMEID